MQADRQEHTYTAKKIKEKQRRAIKQQNLLISQDNTFYAGSKQQHTTEVWTECAKEAEFIRHGT